KVMALAAYGEPRHLEAFRDLIRPTGDGGFHVEPIDWHAFAKPPTEEGRWTSEHADLAASVQARLEEVLLDLARWLHARTGARHLTMAGEVALNSVANTGCSPRGPSTTSGCSRPPATPAPRSAGPSTSPPSTASRSPRWTARTSAAAGPTRSSPHGSTGRACRTSGRTTSPPR